MTRYPSASNAVGTGSRLRRLAIAALAVIVCATDVSAQAPAAPGGAAVTPSTAELEKLVNRIALYPDDLIAIILPAATNPLQVVQAESFLAKRKNDPKLQINDKWDDAVKSLVNYPDVIKTMSADVDWMSALGEAVVADQGAVLAAIQAFRRKAQAAGNLKSDSKQVVVVEKEVINIVPADPEVIYVPQYNPSTVVVSGGYSSWGYYPSPYPVYYYPYAPGAAIATGLIWGAAIGAAWSGGRYATAYGGNANINVDRSVNINSGNVNRTGSVNRTGAVGTTGRQTAGTAATQWKPNKQPGQVSGTVGKTTAGRAGYSTSAGGTGSAAAGRSSAQSDAFGGYGSGRQTQMDSSRGAASRSSMADASPRSSGASAGTHQMSSGARASGAGAGGGGARAGGGGMGGGARAGGGMGGGRGGGGRR